MCILNYSVEVSAADSTTNSDSGATVMYSDNDSDSDGTIFFMDDSLSDDDNAQQPNNQNWTKLGVGNNKTTTKNLC